MEDLVKLIINYGVSVIIIGLFLWDWICNKKDINKTLKQNEQCIEQIEKNTANTAKSLDLLQESMNTQRQFLIEHDKHCQETAENVRRLREEMRK